MRSCGSAEKAGFFVKLIIQDLLILNHYNLFIFNEFNYLAGVGEFTINVPMRCVLHGIPPHPPP